MLSYLHVKNFALINELEIEFNKGFTVMTGETGAGKSIIIGSMNALFGHKLDKGIIRKGSDYALVEMIFEVDKDYAIYLTKNYDVPFDEEHSLILSRRFNASGRSVYRINSEVATGSLMKEIVSNLIDIHSQHDNQVLLRDNYHITLLDRYIGKDLIPLKSALKALYDKYKSYMKELNEGDLDDEHRRREMDFLRFEISEISEAALIEGEDKSLHSEYQVLSHRQKIHTGLANVMNLIEGDRDGSITGQLDMVINIFEGIKQFDNQLKDMSEEADQLIGIVSDLYRSADRYLDGLDMDHQSLESIEQRLHTINSLKVKYGEDISQILESLEEKKKKLDYYEHYEENIERIRNDINVFEEEILKLCGDISAMRQSGARHLGKEIEKLLKELNFNDSKVVVEVKQFDGFNINGFDNVTILISTNKNEDVQPLTKIASGGELSRVMLALKSVFADMDQVSTMVFDEIDTGISGRTAQKVAEKMASLSKDSQIICITHLPQIAAMADKHFLIEKLPSDEERIETTMRSLEELEIHEELARLIGGATITDNTLSSAREMKEQGESLKSH